MSPFARSPIAPSSGTKRALAFPSRRSLSVVSAVGGRLGGSKGAAKGARDPLRRPCQAGSLTGAVHLSKGNAGVLM